jgi:hypothetical protein
MPFLHSVVDALYNGVMQFAPEFLRQRPMFSAPVLGATGAYTAVRALQEISWRWMDRVIPDFDERWLPELEKACLAAIPAVVLATGFADSEGLQETVSKFPVYTAGMVSAYAGAAAGAVMDLMSRHPRQYAELLNGVRVPVEELVSE